MASNSGSPLWYDELKQSEQMTFVTARVSSGDRSRASPAAASSNRMEHRDWASAQTEEDTGDTTSSVTDVLNAYSLKLL